MTSDMRGTYRGGITNYCIHFSKSVYDLDNRVDHSHNTIIVFLAIDEPAAGLL